MSNLETAAPVAVSDKTASLEVPAEEQVKTATAPEVIEPKAEVKPEEKEQPKDKFAPKFAALSRKEKELRLREQQNEEKFAKRQADLEAREKALGEQDAKAQARARLKKEKPLEFLSEEGLTYEEITKAILGNPEISKEDKVEQLIAAQQEQIASLAKKLEDKDKREQEEKEKAELSAVEKKHSETISGFKGEIDTFLKSSTDYEFLMNNPFNEDPVDAVYETVSEYYKEHKTILSVKEAADLVEKYVEAQVEKLAKTKKGSTKFTPSKEEPTKQEAAPSNSPKTLENAHSSQVPNRQARKLTDDELIAEAAKHVRWNKN